MTSSQHLFNIFQHGWFEMVNFQQVAESISFALNCNESTTLLLSTLTAPSGPGGEGGEDDVPLGFGGKGKYHVEKIS